MSRLRGYCFTLNNYTDDDLADLIIFADYCTYMVCGFEHAPDTGTPHIQGYMHFAQGKSMVQVHKHVSRAALLIPNAKGDKFERRYLYCIEPEEGKGDKGTDVWEFGHRPVNGAPVTAYKVKDAIAEGKTLSELRDIFPLYMISNGPKVKAYLSLQSKSYETKFWVHEEIKDAITEVYEGFDDEEFVVVTELSQLEAYEDYTNVIFIAEYCEKLHSLWPRGVPITYKYGYQQVTVKCKNFVIVTGNPKLYIGNYNLLYSEDIDKINGF